MSKQLDGRWKNWKYSVELIKYLASSDGKEAVSSKMFTNSFLSAPRAKTTLETLETCRGTI